MSLSTRTVNIHVVQQGTTPVVARFLPELSGEGADLLLERYYSAVIDPVTGIGSIDLPVRPSGTITYAYEISSSGRESRGEFNLAAGAPISLGDLIIGGLTATDPIETYINSVIAALQYADLADVDLTGLADGNVPVWNAAAGKWKPGTAAGGGGGAPSGPAGGVLSGTYPNPGFADDMATQAELDAHKTSGDHDGRYYTETEVDTALAAKADASAVTTALALKADTSALTSGLALKANLASPALTGSPTAPTASGADNSTKIATTAFVKTNAAAETTTTLGTLVNGATAKTPPVDADMVPLMDSAASNIIKKLSWANIKATLKTYFDTLYQAVLVSGTNIKTVNGSSLLGSGDLDVRQQRVATATSSATPTPNAGTTDVFVLTAQAAAAAFAAPTGTPTDGQTLVIRVKDNGTARALSFNAIYRETTVPLPTTTTLSETMYIALIYNATDTKWDVVGVA